jgi:hypothetical protein
MTTAIQLADTDKLMQFAAGLSGLSLNPEGFGALGPFGNDASKIQPNTNYQVTGDAVALRNPLNVGLPNDSSVIARLNTGDTVQSDAGPTTNSVTDANGNTIYFAFVRTSGGTQGWLAVEYLAPAGTITKPGGGIVPPKLVAAMKSPSAFSPTTMALIAAGALGVGLVGYAVYRKSKGKKSSRSVAREGKRARAKQNPVFSSTADKAVKRYVDDLMPEDVKKARRAALASLYGYGADPDGPSYMTALDTIRDWIDSDMPQTLYYDVQSGYVDETEPEGFEDEEGQWIEHDDYYMYDRGQIKRVVFGALVTDGGL